MIRSIAIYCYKYLSEGYHCQVLSIKDISYYLVYEIEKRAFVSIHKNSKSPLISVFQSSYKVNIIEYRCFLQCHDDDDAQVVQETCPTCALLPCYM